MRPANHKSFPPETGVRCLLSILYQDEHFPDDRPKLCVHRRTVALHWYVNAYTLIVLTLFLTLVMIMKADSYLSISLRGLASGDISSRMGEVRDTPHGLYRRHV